MFFFTRKNHLQDILTLFRALNSKLGTLMTDTTVLAKTIADLSDAVDNNTVILKSLAEKVVSSGGDQANIDALQTAAKAILTKLAAADAEATAPPAPPVPVAIAGQ